MLDALNIDSIIKMDLGMDMRGKFLPIEQLDEVLASSDGEASMGATEHLVDLEQNDLVTQKMSVRKTLTLLDEAGEISPESPQVVVDDLPVYMDDNEHLYIEFRELFILGFTVSVDGIAEHLENLGLSKRVKFHVLEKLAINSSWENAYSFMRAQMDNASVSATIPFPSPVDGGMSVDLFFHSKAKNGDKVSLLVRQVPLEDSAISTGYEEINEVDSSGERLSAVTFTLNDVDDDGSFGESATITVLSPQVAINGFALLASTDFTMEVVALTLQEFSDMSKDYEDGGHLEVMYSVLKDAFDASVIYNDDNEK